MNLLLPILFAATTFLMAFAFDRAARRRAAESVGDSGFLWAAVAGRFGVCLWPALLLSQFLETLAPGYFARGWHLHADRTGVSGLAPAAVYPWALLVPGLIWLLFLFRSLGRTAREPARWLAGSAGLAPSRGWAGWTAAPLLVLGLVSAGRLGGGLPSYPAATWSSLWLFTLTLFFVAASRGEPGSTPATPRAAAAAAAPSRVPWLATLQGRGLELKHLGTLEGAAAAERPRSEEKTDLGRLLASLGAAGVEPELVRAFDSLIRPQASAARLLLEAPDDCGQVEAVAVLARLLHQRYLERTLIVVAGGAHQLAARLAEWIGRGTPAGFGGASSSTLAVPEASSPLPWTAAVWVVDLETLSNVVLPRLFLSPSELRRLGLVVWWDLHQLSGVYGANLWALSRRLHRLVRRGTEEEVRTLALLRSSPRPGAEAADFVGRVLPQDFRGHQVTLPFRAARRVHLYQVVSQQVYFERGFGGPFEARLRHPALTVARESLLAGWPTRLDAPAEVGLSALEAFGRLSLGEGSMAEALVAETAAAGASVQTVGEADVLALAARFGQAGRASPDTEHHVAILAAANPYLRHLLEDLGPDFHPRCLGPEGAGRRLICAAGNPALLERHILLALGERPDTRDGLRRDFLREDDAIRRTLQALVEAGVLGKREVRHLDQDRRLVIDHLLRSLEPAQESLRPLDAVGRRLVELVDPAAGHEEKQGVLMSLDPERLTVLAYPGRIFMSRGNCYEVRPWISFESVAARGFVECNKVDFLEPTWRQRTLLVDEIEVMPGAIEIRSADRRLLVLRASALMYQEMIFGFLRLRRRGPGAGSEELEIRHLTSPLLSRFKTRGLLLLLPQAIERAALASLAESLRPVLAVHLGVEDEVLELVPVIAVQALGRSFSGLAVVELYPGGIGVLEALNEVDRFFPDLLLRARDWLRSCACGSDLGCESCLHSPMARAAAGNLPLRRSEALRLLDALVGGPGPGADR